MGRKIEILQGYSVRKPEGQRRQLHVRFLVSPVELLGDARGRPPRLTQAQDMINARAQGTERGLRKLAGAYRLSQVLVLAARSNVQRWVTPFTVTSIWTTFEPLNVSCRRVVIVRGPEGVEVVVVTVCTRTPECG